jgi:anti-sigma B factor antagonist
MIVIPEEKANSVVVHVKGKKIDAASAVEFKNSVAGIVDKGSRNIVLDLSEVDFIDSSGLGALVGVLKHIGHQGSLLISGATPGVERVFKLTRMDKIFRLYPNVDAALVPA